MTTLNRNLRRDLENAVKKARRTAEVGATKAVEQLAVHHHEPWQHMSVEERRLRNRLRAHGRQLGDLLDRRTGTQAIGRLVAEVAYEHWHRMLFARFLAENDLLIEPDTEMPLSLAECRELAREEGTDWLPMASSFAQRMLPQIFRADDPALELSLPAETRQDLERILAGLPSEVFVADDSLGWVYQFWQAEKKDQVNKSGEKIGADELPAVTQLFTEDYMVLFLLHNTLGAWWAGKRLKENPELTSTAKDEEELRRACSVGGYEWTYLRFIREEDEGPWRPAAGTFDRWPTSASEITVMDPSMGSGHFLVFALPILVAFRMEEEGLSKEEAVLAVLRDNLHGLEIDPRCTQIAAFNLAFAAWKALGHVKIPDLNLACVGIEVAATEQHWCSLAGEDSQARATMAQLYQLLKKAPLFGSLIDPERMSGDLLARSFHNVSGLVKVGLNPSIQDDSQKELIVAARGLAKAVDLLTKKYSSVFTNVPYLIKGKQSPDLRSFLVQWYPGADTDVATCFLERISRMLCSGGIHATVAPQNWLYLSSYKTVRTKLLGAQSLAMVVRIGSGATSTASWDVLRGLTVWEKNTADENLVVAGIDAPTPDETSRALAVRNDALLLTTMGQLRKAPDSMLSPGFRSSMQLLGGVASAYQGIKTGDDGHYRRLFWETPRLGFRWRTLISTTDRTLPYSGMESVVDWIDEGACLARRQGVPAWGKRGVVASQMRQLPCALYMGDLFDSNVSAIVPKDQSLVPALWAFCSSDSFNDEVRKVDQSLAVTNGALAKVPFVAGHWEELAKESFQNTLPEPNSASPTQWVFGGSVCGASSPLQVAVARLVGYRWPRQAGEIPYASPATGSDELNCHEDQDGIVPLSSLYGEGTAADRLGSLLCDAYGEAWSSAKQNALLEEVGFGGKSLDDWLKDGFFEQHCDLFQRRGGKRTDCRPFVWHIWDGLRNGFHALVNYHKLAGPNGEGRRTLDKLLYTYLGDWISRRRADLAAGKEGADAQVSAAEQLHKQLELIKEGEPPFDIFVRWKALSEQPLGWEPDINDGVRLNIRPFMKTRPLNAKAKNSSILRITPRINWNKDGGREPKRDRDDYPWFWTWDGKSQDFAGTSDFDGNRWNDLHYSRAARLDARRRNGGEDL